MIQLNYFIKLINLVTIQMLLRPIDSAVDSCTSATDYAENVVVSNYVWAKLGHSQRRTNLGTLFVTITHALIDVNTNKQKHVIGNRTPEARLK